MMSANQASSYDEESNANKVPERGQVSEESDSVISRYDGTEPDHDPLASGATRSQAVPITLVLSCATPEQCSDLKITVRIRNTGDVPLVLDKLCSIFFTWEVRAHIGDEINTITSSELPDGPGHEELQSRLVSLKPGEQLTRTMTLTHSVLQYVTARSDVGGISAYETFLRFQIPHEAESVDVRLKYGRGFEEPEAFKMRFGHLPEQLGIWTGKAQSDWLGVSLR